MNLKRINYAEKLINWIHEKLNEKQFLIFSSILVGLSAGLAAVILKRFVHFIRHYIIEERVFAIDYKYLYLILPGVGIALTVIITRRFFKGNLHRGADHILFAIARKSSFISFPQIYSHVITSGLTIGFGGSSGLESPIVSTGAAIGSNYARRYRLTYKERTLLLAAGAAGGIAGAFNAPIAGILFALEVLLVDISITAFIPLLIASASGALISKIILNENILLYFKLRQDFDYHNLLFYILLGIVAGVVSIYHVNSFDKMNERLRKLKSPFVRVLLAALCLALLCALFPPLFGEGYETIKSLADVQLSSLYRDSILAPYVSSGWHVFLFISAAMLLKAIAVAITLGSGGNGGNFAPALFIGAYLGFAFAFSLQALGFKEIPFSNFILVGMAGTLCGVFHAPLTAIFLIAEITGGYELIIPLMIVSSISYTVVKYYHPDSPDVRRLKKRGTVISEDRDTSILAKIEITSLIEHDFTTLRPDEKLRDIVEKIKSSRRNVFPVVKQDNKLIGVISLDHIRKEMFNFELYDSVTARELMQKPDYKIRASDDIFTVMKKFEESGQWNLPVTRGGVYLGFLSKSGILSQYRNELLESV